MKSIALALLVVIGTALFILIKFNFIYSLLYFIGHLSLVWAYRKWGFIQEPVKNPAALAGLLVLGPTVYLLATTGYGFANQPEIGLSSSLMKNGLMIGVIVTQYVMILVSFKKPLLDRY